MDSPAVVTRNHSGERVAYCPCCRFELRPATPAEQPVRPANLIMEVTAEHVMFVDDRCGYDIVVLKNIRAR